MQKILVAVSPEDIEAAKQFYDLTHTDTFAIERIYVCPIAMALTSLVKDKVTVHGNGRCRIGSRVTELPYEAQVFMAQFDEQMTGSPFSFELELPEEVELR